MYCQKIINWLPNEYRLQKHSSCQIHVNTMRQVLKHNSELDIN